MFKPLKKSLHYVLVFPSLLAVSLTTHHPRMGEVPLDPSRIITKAFTAHCRQRGTLVRWNWASPMFLTASCYPHKQKFDNWHHLPCVFPEKCIPLNCCPLMRSALIWQGSLKTVAPLLHSPDRQIINSHEASFYMSRHIRYAHRYGRISNLHLS